MSEQIEGKIAAILDKSTVVINRGHAHGVDKGEAFYIYSTLGPFVDPDTGEALGTTTRVWGKVEVTIIEDKFCVAKTPYESSLFAGFPSYLFGNTHIELPVAVADISKGLEKIKIGFSVISEKHKVRELPEKKALTLTESTTEK